MASGQTHTMTTLCASAIGLAYYGLDNIPASSAWLLGGLWCTIVQPDLDVDDGFYGLSVLNKGTPYYLTAIITCDFLHWLLDWRVWGALRLFRQ